MGASERRKYANPKGSVVVRIPHIIYIYIYDIYIYMYIYIYMIWMCIDAYPTV